MVEQLFYGHPLTYWIELERRFQHALPNGEELLDEIVQLQGKVAFYEARIRQMVRLLPK